MDKPSTTNHRFETLARSCLTMWNRYFPNKEVHKHLLELARLFDSSENIEQARLFTLDSHLSDLMAILSPSDFAETLSALTSLCQFFTERGALAKNPFVFSEASSVVIATHQNPPAAVLKERIQEHLDYRVKRGSIVVGSVSSYSSDLNQFFSYLIDHCLDLNVEAIEKFALSLAEMQANSKFYARTTISRKKNSLRAYLGVEIKRENIQLNEDYQDYLITRKKDKTPENPYTSLNLEEIGLLMTHLATLDLRSQLEVLLPLILGIRAEEVVDLQVKHFNFMNGYVELLETKNGLPRNVPMPDFLEQMIKEYFKLTNLSHFDYLFPSLTQEAICRKTLTEHIKKMICAAGIKRPASCHHLRSTFANLQLYHNQTSFLTLQTLMGHRDLETTLKYARDKLQDKTPPLCDLYLDWARLLRPNSLSTASEGSTDITAVYYYPKALKQMGSNNLATSSSEPRNSIFRVVK